VTKIWFIHQTVSQNGATKIISYVQGKKVAWSNWQEAICTADMMHNNDIPLILPCWLIDHAGEFDQK